MGGTSVARSHLAGLLPALLAKLTARANLDPGRRPPAVQPYGAKHRRETRTRPARRNADA